MVSISNIFEGARDIFAGDIKWNRNPLVFKKTQIFPEKYGNSVVQIPKNFLRSLICCSLLSKKIKKSFKYV